MANALTQDAAVDARRQPALGLPAKWRFEPGQLHRLSRHEASSLSTPPTRSGALFEFALLREITLDPAATKAATIDDRRRHVARAEEEQRGAARRGSSREIDLLREMLADHAKRIAARDMVIDQLKRRLAAANAERQTNLRQLSATVAERRSAGRRQRTIRAIGSLMVTLAEMTQAPPPRLQPPLPERDAGAQPAARALAEKALLDLIAQQHRRWLSRGGDAE